MWNPAVSHLGLCCPLCALEGEATGERALGTRLVAHADTDTVVLVGPDAADVLVASRRHLVKLARTSDVAAPPLAAMRVVVNVMRSALGAAGATIEPTLEIGGPGHVSFRVVPTTSDLGHDAPSPDVETMVALLAGALASVRRPVAQRG